MGVSKCLSKHNHKNVSIKNEEKNTCKVFMCKNVRFFYVGGLLLGFIPSLQWVTPIIACKLA